MAGMTAATVSEALRHAAWATSRIKAGRSSHREKENCDAVRILLEALADGFERVATEEQQS